MLNVTYTLNVENREHIDSPAKEASMNVYNMRRDQVGIVAARTVFDMYHRQIGHISGASIYGSGGRGVIGYVSADGSVYTTPNNRRAGTVRDGKIYDANFHQVGFAEGDLNLYEVAAAALLLLL